MQAMTVSATNIGRRKRPRRCQHMDLFDIAKLEASDAMLWPELPERGRSALTELMARMILAHAATAVPLPAKEDGDDL